MTVVCSALLPVVAQHTECGAAGAAAVVQIAKPAAVKAAVAEEGCLPLPGSIADVIAAVVTVTFARADYLRQHLDSLLAVHGRKPDNWWENLRSKPCTAVGLGLRLHCMELVYTLAAHCSWLTSARVCCRQHTAAV